MRGRVGLQRFAVLSVLGALVALIGCTSGGPQPNRSSATVSGSTTGVATTSPAPSPSPTSPYPADVPLTGHNVKPGEKPPLFRDAAKAHSQAGANAFAEFFMHTLDWMYATTNSAYPRHYYGTTCGLCSGLSSGIDKTAAKAHWYEGDRFTIHTATAAPIAPVTAPADYCSIVVVDTTSSAVVDATGHVYDGDGAHLGDKVKVCVKSDGDGWHTTYLAFTK